MNQTNLSAFIWSVADLLRGNYRPHEYGKVILPFTVLRRLDCVLAPTKAKVLAELEAKTKLGVNPDCWRSPKTDHLCALKIDQGWSREIGLPARPV